MHIPDRLARREIASNRFMTHVEEDLRAPDGSVYTYHQVEAKWEAVLVLPILADGKLVLERVFRNPYRRYFLEFPAGGIEHGEDPVAAAGRELTEETGYRAATLRRLGAYEAIPGMLKARIHIILAQDLVQTGTRSHETMELLQVVELTAAEAWRESEGDAVSSFLTVGLLYLQREGLA